MATASGSVELLKQLSRQSSQGLGDELWVYRVCIIAVSIIDSNTARWETK